jgi:hypothetical protein
MKMPKGQIKFTKEDRAWSQGVKERDSNACVICKHAGLINAHHIIPREITWLKHNLMNGITLCPRHHRFSREISAHQNPFKFILWLEKNRPEQYLYLKALFANE